MPAVCFMECHAPTARVEALRPVYRPVLERMAAEFARPLSIARLARMIHRTPLQFLREFSQLLGMTPHAFLVETRVQAARSMMRDRKSTRLNSSHGYISYAVFCLKKKKKKH